MTDAAPLPAARRSPPPIFWVLMGMVLLFLLLGVGSIAYYLRISHAPPTTLWEKPWDMPQPQRVSSGLAIWSLAGAPPDLVYRQAMAWDELDTVAALTLLTPNLPDDQRLGWSAVLARRFTAAQRPTDAQALLRDTANLALLLPELSDHLRAQTLLQVASGWDELGEREQALWALDQALVIGQSSPQLTPALRKNLLVEIGQRYIQLDEAARGQAIAAIPVLDYQSAPPRAFSLAPHLSSPPYPESLLALQKERWQAAQAYVADWEQRGGVASAAAARNLENKLIDEDLGRRGYYEEQLAREDLDNALRARILFDEVTWLAIKYRAASGLYGDSLAPNWQAERPAIRATLNEAIAALNAALADAIAQLPADQQEAGAIARDRMMLSWAAIGLYADADLDALTAALNQDVSASGEAGVYPRASVQKGRIRLQLFYKQPSAPDSGS